MMERTILYHKGLMITAKHKVIYLNVGFGSFSQTSILFVLLSSSLIHQDLFFFLTDFVLHLNC